MTSRDHRSIGEVLSLLADEYPDLTVSKIRFLESKGLIAPERTPSGYRKFYEADVERLRWVLEQQRDHYLPLKEIKRRLDDEAPPSSWAEIGRVDEAAEASEDSEDGAAASSELLSSELLEGSVSLTAAELANVVDVNVTLVYELIRLGLIAPTSGGLRVNADESLFDHEAMLTVRAVVAFLEHGVPARSLRMYKVAADREAGVFEQVVSSLIARGDRARLRHELTELVDLADKLRRSLLRRLLSPHLG